MNHSAKEQAATDFNLKKLGFLGKENDKEVEQLIDEPTNGSGDPDLGLIFLPIWLTHSTQISSPESDWHNNYHVVWPICITEQIQNIKAIFTQNDKFFRR